MKLKKNLQTILNTHKRYSVNGMLHKLQTWLKTNTNGGEERKEF